MFRHILNFMRNSKLLIAEDFCDLELLLEEAKYFEIVREYLDQIPIFISYDHRWQRIFSISKCQLTLIFSFIFAMTAMIRQIEQMKRDRMKNGVKTSTSRSPSPSRTSKTSTIKKINSDSYEVVALQISPDLGERILMSSERNVLDEIFPETNQAILDARSGVAWNQFEGRQVIRFPLNGYCKLNSIQVITRLLNSGFSLEASTGYSSGVENQQFSEYLLVRKNNI